MRLRECSILALRVLAKVEQIDTVVLPNVVTGSLKETARHDLRAALQSASLRQGRRVVDAAVLWLALNPTHETTISTLSLKGRGMRPSLLSTPSAPKVSLLG